ncbi:MAG: universal stress protein [Flavobacteriaceae bacterium]|nr:universal stress protein [Bacteroidia bacterium]MBT8288107.1 universal stress protein [Bacteroidia bacterium]NNF74312.1 universal stress protein [Flavobacteriaceae bacterium]NNK71961.1 universal stress protein [Flavobacteriaceae bacterium]
MKKILVPTDFSEQAENALKVAAQLAREYDAEIYLLHLLELPLHQIDALSGHSDLPEAMFFMKLAQKRFQDVLAKEYLEGITVNETVEFHQSFSHIVDVCEEKKIDLIVMGSHGVSGIKEMFIGSNTEKVVRTATVPVLVIKKPHDHFEVNDFVFASDFNKDSAETYKQAAFLASSFNAQLHLVMVNTPNNFLTTAEANKRIAMFTDDSDYENYSVTIYNDETVETGILNFSQSIDADLIGISTHGRQGIAHFFNGSISEDLVNHAERPVVTFRI